MRLVPALLPLTLSCLTAACSHSRSNVRAMEMPASAVSEVAGSAPGADRADKLVVEAWVQLSSDDVGKTVAAIRQRVSESKGRVVEEQLSGSTAQTSYATLRVRVPSAETTGFLDWLERVGEVTSRRVQATDVSKTLFDLSLALENLRLTSSRLQQLLAKEGLAMADVLAIEKELTRIRGEIEQLEGQRRWLADRVELSTIELVVNGKGGPETFAPQAKVQLGPTFSALRLLDPNGRAATRWGGGLTLGADRSLTLDLVVFPELQGEGRSLVATLGGASYSDFLGGGRRTFLNPYLGMRLGYAYLGEPHLVLAGELGLELYKQKYVVVDLSARVLGLVFNRSEVAFQGALSAQVPF